LHRSHDAQRIQVHRPMTHMTNPLRRLLLLTRPLLLAGSLSGCVAAAIPVLAGGVLAENRLRGSRPEPTVDVIGAAAVAPAIYADAPATPPAPPPAELPANSPAPPATELAATDISMPVPIAPPAASIPSGSPDALADFARFAIARAAPPPPRQHRQSAFIDPATILATPRWQDCGDHPAAVVIDLDPAGGAFNPDDPPSPARGLAEQLAALRSAGITVLWASANPVAAAPKVSIVLQATGLDPERTDRLLLLRSATERKQTRRLAAARDWCVVAMAGNARGDFDEMFDYLRDPDGPVTTALAPSFGAGWFLIPNPID
jgi:hypothetical protein